MHILAEIYFHNIKDCASKSYFALFCCTTTTTTDYCVKLLYWFIVAPRTGVFRIE